MSASSAGSMRAAVITRPGGPDVLAIEERPRPVPGDDEILVRVHATALNRADLHQREGHYPAPPGSPQDILGMEFAGEVEGAGRGVTEWRAGDRVFGIVGGGASAEYLVTDARCVARVPDAMALVDAAAAPEAFMTVHDAMVTQAGVRAGDHVLIYAVGSGVGLAAVQLARALGAVPYGTARTADKIERARPLGLGEGLVVRDDLEPLVAAVPQWTGGHGADVILDLVGGPYVAASIRVAASRGRIMLIGTVAGRTATIPSGMMLGKRLTMRGTVMRARSLEEKRAVTAAFARDVVPLLASGAVRPIVDRVYDLAEIREAHERMERNESFGKLVLRVAE